MADSIISDFAAIAQRRKELAEEAAKRPAPSLPDAALEATIVHNGIFGGG